MGNQTISFSPVIAYQVERKSGSGWEYMCSFGENQKDEAIAQRNTYLKLHPNEKVRIWKVTKEIVEIEP